MCSVSYRRYRHIVIVDDEDMWNDLHEEDQLIMNEAIEQHTTERLACYAYSLQLCVKDGLNQLKTTESLLAKCSKLANLTHQSALFRGTFESKFGKGRSIPKTNTTRWNSMYVQLSSIIRLDLVSLSDLLKRERSILTQREMAMLRELVEILQSFAEATDLLQGDSYLTIGCVVSSIVDLHRCLNTLSSTVKYQTPLVNALLSSLCDRFGGLFQNVKILPTKSESGDRIKRNPNFSSPLYLMASALDPSYSLLWLEEDHPGPDDAKRFVREVSKKILLFLVFCLNY